MRTVMFIFAFALLLVAACGGTSSSNADTSLTVDQIVGIWKVEAVDILKDTCEFPGTDVEEEEGSYAYLEKASDSQIKVYSCDTDATCADKEFAETYAYSKGRMTIPGGESEIVNASGCRAYIDTPDTSVIFSSASAATATMSGTVRFEGTCDLVKAANAQDPAHPDKTLGDYEGCQMQIRRTNTKQ